MVYYRVQSKNLSSWCGNVEWLNVQRNEEMKAEMGDICQMIQPTVYLT